jgi:potassium-transporting ATPase ATP-binding subunit
LDSHNEEIKILKGSVEAMLKLVPNVNEAELKWKAQEISKNGQTPFMVAIDIEAIGLVALKDR